MKLLYINNWCHHKNLNALLHYKNIEIHQINSEQLNNIDLTNYDAVYNPSEPIDVSKYSNKKTQATFIFGPHFSIFPDEKIISIKHKNAVYIQPSQWAKNVWKNYNNRFECVELNIIQLPFGVETDKFNEIKLIQERTKVFVYFKHRNQNELFFLSQFLNNMGIEFRIFGYDCRYDEADYLQYLQESKYGIILDAHESQGFAIEEALSCNVPLFVWNVKSMNQEEGCNYPDFPATSIPYWDERCGEFFYNADEIEETLRRFLSKLETYRPRNYVLETLSMDVCEKRLIEFVSANKTSMNQYEPV